MSPSVYGSTRLLLSTTNQDLRMFNKPEIRKVKRILFGPVDRAATQKFIDDERKKIMLDQTKKYNFNFLMDHPLPEGQYTWRPATPQKEERVVTPIKRKLNFDIDISDQYYELSEADIVRPRPIKCASPTQERGIQQSRITDFMKATKRQLCDVSKKQPSSSSSSSSSSDWKPQEIPTKIPRLNILS